MRVLLVEDDQRIAADVGHVLSAAGYIVEVTTDGEDAWFKGDTEDYGAVVLDLGMPGMDGLAVLKRWRTAGRVMPVLVLTARGSWTERVEGIDAGADDYLPKPCQMEELLARLRALIRRSSGRPAPILSLGDVAVDEKMMRVTRNGIPINLSALEYRLFVYLARHAGRVVPQTELLENVYGDDDRRSDNTLEVLIGRVRKKLGGGVIETRRGFGYVIPGGNP